MSTSTDTRRASSDGFTLIEMIVALVILALAMAAIFPAIGNLMRGSSRGASSAQATGDAAIVAKLLEEDIRTALGDRGTGERSDVATNLSTIPALSAGNAAYSDIVSAGPTRLLLNADVVDLAGVERVEWILITNSPECGEYNIGGSNNWCLRRTIRSSTGATLSSEVLTKSRGTYPIVRRCGGLTLTGTRVFCYEEAFPATGNYTWNGGWTPACSKSWTNDGTSPNTGNRTLATPRFNTRHNAVEPTSSIARLDRIITVGATIYSGGGFAKAGELSYENAEIAVRSREGEAYREAIMCGLRAGWGR